MRKVICLCLITAALIEQTAGAQVLRMAPEESMPVRVSGHDLTRIAISGGRIAKVWGQAARVEVKADSEEGQVFIQPTSSAEEEFALYLRDDIGDTYTLLITPDQGAAETIFIQRQMEAEKKIPLPPDTPYVRRIKYWMRLLSVGSRPAEASVDDSRHSRDWRSDVIMSRVLQATADGWHGERYVLRNNSASALSLTEEDFADFEDRVLAVQIEHHSVPAGGRTTVSLLRRQ